MNIEKWIIAHFSRALPAPFVAGAIQMLSEKAAGYKKPVVFL